MDKTKLGLEKFPLKTFDKIRYNDTDRQGHVNNATFSTFLETGRVEVLYNPQFPILLEGASFVIAALRLNFKQEIKWPGQVEIGTGLRKIGNSSMVLYQELFQRNQCVANAETVIVQVDAQTGASQPLSAESRTILATWLLQE